MGTYTSATKAPTTALTHNAEGIPTADRSSQHAVGRDQLGSRHAALVVGVEAFAAHIACAEVVGTAGVDPCSASGDVAVETR